MPQGNYTVLKALEAGYLFREPPDYRQWLSVLEEHLARPEDPRMWNSLAPDLRFLVNGDHARAEALIGGLFEEYPGVLLSWEGVYLLAHVHHWVSPDRFRGWLETLRDAAWKEGPQAFGELLVFVRVVHSDWEWARREIQKVMEGQAAPGSKEHRIRIGAAYAAANLWHEDGDRTACTEIFVGLLSQPDGAVGKALLDFFRYAEKLPHCTETATVLDAMIASPWLFRDSRDFFLDQMLVNHISVDPERVFQLSTVVVEQLAERLRDFSSSGPMHAEKLVHTAITLQRTHDYREKGLALFERLLELEAYGAREALRDIDVDRWTT